jgi:hypothetical protein
LKRTDLKKISPEARVPTVVNTVAAAISGEQLLPSKTRKLLRDFLLDALKNQTNSSDPAVYLGLLTNTQVKALYPLFIEASKEILSAFATLTTFPSLVAEAVKMPMAQCCSYIRANRAVFTKYAIPTITTNEVPNYSDLIELGPCLAGTLGSDLISKVNSSDVVSYFSNAGASHQPDSKEISVLRAKILEAEGSFSDKEEFVFQRLKSLAVFYSKYSTLNSVS